MNKNVRIALLFLGLLFVWFLSGFVSDTQKKEQTSKKKAVSQSVQALNLKGQMYSPQLILKANTEAFRELKLISQVSGKIREIYVTELKPLLCKTIFSDLSRFMRPRGLQQEPRWGSETVGNRATLDQIG